MRVVRVAINAVALFIAALLVPGIHIDWSDDAAGIGITLLVLALLFGLVNSFVRPLARLVSIPLTIATLGLFSLVLNAALLLTVAYLIDLVWLPLITIADFPPDLSIEAVITAAVGSFIISVIATSLRILIPDP